MSFLQQLSEAGVAEPAPLGRAARPEKPDSPILQGAVRQNSIYNHNQT